MLQPPSVPAAAVGDLLRGWRQRRRFSQMELALEAEISTRHLSFVETGRAAPSRQMLMRLAGPLDLPLRERNRLLLAAGFAPLYAERALEDPKLEPARQAVELVLKGHEPFPALAVDRHWTLLSANRPAEALMQGCAAPLLAGPVNVLRLSLHPDGLASRIVNLGEWRAHLLERLQRQIEQSGDPVLRDLRAELADYPTPEEPPALDEMQAAAGAVFVPLRLAVNGAVLSFFSTTTVFGTPVDITLSELALESFFPADAATAQILRR